MKNWSLRTRLTVILATTLAIFSLLSGLAYLAHSRAEDRLGGGFADQLMVLTELPFHRNELRRVDAFADNFLTTRDPVWLQRRAELAASFAANHTRIGALIHDTEEKDEWDAIGREFALYDASQRDLFKRSHEGKVTRVEAIRQAIDNETVDRHIERMSHFGRLSFVRLDLQRRAAREAALITFGLVLSLGLVGSLAVAAAVSSIVLQPVAKLREQAGSWKLGQPWSLDMKEGPPEIRELMSAMSRMASQLNAQYEKERAAGRLKSQLVSGVSHEFNNALAVIHTAHALLKENEPSTAAAGPWHEMLAANIRALSTMATNLLNLGRLEAGKFDLEIQRVDAAVLLRGAVSRLEILAQRKKLTVSLDLAAAELPCAGDPDALSLVVANLFTNAVKYTHEGGSITLGARNVGRAVELFVKDTGIGVAPQDKEKIFKEYFRSEEGKREAKGFGVGLALSRMILEAHHTDLELESALGVGSRFSFKLPAFVGGISDLRP